jgi:para-aminobenzoate synthetase
MRVLLVDNYDSFSANVAHYLGEVIGAEPTVVRNNEIDWPKIEAADYDAIVISPGPGRPERPADMGVSNDVLANATCPVLGVCLGHQAMAYVHGGTIVHAPKPMHGRMNAVEHEGSGLFAHIPSPFEVVRYHSLMVQEPLPAGLRVTARTPDGLVMAIEHETRPMWGVQFHPESINTEFGRQIIHNFIEMARGRLQRKRRHVYPIEIRTPAPAAKPASETWQIQSRRIKADIDPQSAFISRYAHSDAAFWLDSSAVRPGYSRFSFMGDGHDDTARSLVHHVGNDPQGESERMFAAIRDGLAVSLEGGATLPFDFVGGWIGYFGYELKALTEVGGRHRSEQPDLFLRFICRFLAYDHLEGCWYAVATGPAAREADDEAWLREAEESLQTMHPVPLQSNGDRNAPVEFHLEMNRTTYYDRISQCLSKIGDGETYEVCLTNRMRATVDLDPLTLYCDLRRINPAPYAAFLRYGTFNVLSSSPERFLHLSPNGVVEIKPIKGTRRRAADVDEDQAIVNELKRCEKDRAENLMIVDLTRNDLARVCEVGSVWVPKLMQVESYASVHQLVSTVRAQLRSGLDVVDLLQATFPGGSMTGAPKRRTLDVIDSLECSARGIYSGTIGYLSLNGAADLSMVIRTLVQQDDKLELGVGGAIIALSDANDEFEETIVKARALMRAVAYCATGDTDAWRIPGEETAPESSGTTTAPAPAQHRG